MEENETVHPDYQKGFNEGYAIAKIASEIATTLRNVEAKGERIEGIKAGIYEFFLEKEKQMLPDWLKNERPKLSIKDRTSKDSKGRDFEKE